MQFPERGGAGLQHAVVNSHVVHGEIRVKRTAKI